MPPENVRFDSFAIGAERLAALAALSWGTPTEVQAKGLGHALAGRDLLVCAPTGTGKTGLYGISMLERIGDAPARPGRPLGVVVVPTRELAEQVGRVVHALGAKPKPAVLFGGVSYSGQDHALQQRASVVIATFGRLFDHVRRGSLRLDDVQVVVIDEADRLFDAGFIDDLRHFLSLLPEQRQTILLSATLPPEMPEFSRAILTRPVRIQTAAITTREKIEESFYIVDGERKVALLEKLLREWKPAQALIFARTQRKADQVTRALGSLDDSVGALHAGMTQSERTAALDAFRMGKLKFLVATDVASRGIDIPDLALVINFDVPNTPEDYIHRSGRTARMERRGTAVTFLTAREQTNAAAIEHLIRHRIPEIRLPGFAPGEAEVETLRPEREDHVRSLEKARPLHAPDALPTGKAKKESPFTRDGKLRRAYRTEEDTAAENDSRRNAKKRALKRIKNKKLPHQRKKG